MKTCSRCSKALPLNNFHRQQKSKDGYRWMCKKCVSLERRKYYLAHKRQEAETHKIYRENNRKKFKESWRRHAWRAKIHPTRYKARYTVGNALRKGSLIKTPCIICQKEKVEAHHSDYTKPLAVTWFCKSHHMAWHRVFSPDGL